MSTKTFSFFNSQVSYRVRGKGAPVMLLHGFAEDGSIWDELADKLSARYRLIIPDIPGSGSSTLLSNDQAGMEGYADAMHALLEKESIEQCSIIGHSMGGYIALAFAEKYPAKLNALGLFHSSAYADDAAKIETRQKAIGFIEQNGAAAFLKTSIPGLFADAEKSNAEIAILLEKGKTFSSEALIQYYESMMARPDRTYLLKTLGVPILFIMGQHDKAVPFEHSLQQSHLPKQAHIHILRQSAHMGMLEEREKSFEVSAHFLQTVYV
jgi:pimeloyl-ACP methyl ester carboxylesterase